MTLANPHHNTSADVDHCTALVRDSDRDSYLIGLLLTPELRQASMVLQAFHVEITNVVLSNPEPMAGEIRLQWWIEVLSGGRNGEAQGHPVARALLALIEQYELPVSALTGKVEAHIFDLYRDPIETNAQLEGWCGATRSSLFQLSALCAGHEPSTGFADACGHAGMAAGLVSIIESIPRQRAFHQTYVPDELLARHGLNVGTYLADSDELHNSLAVDLIGLAKKHHALALDNISRLDRPSRVTFLSLALVPLYLRRAEKQPERIWTGLPNLSQLQKQWTLFRAKSRPPYVA